MNLHRAVPVLTVTDTADAVTAYQAALGVDVLMDLGWIVTLGDANHPKQAQFSVITHDATAPLNPALSLEVDDVDGAYRRAQDAGLEIVYPVHDEEWGVRRFFFRDPDGTVVNVVAHR